jgi:Spy/CpxP family protein refolding chaperone
MLRNVTRGRVLLSAAAVLGLAICVSSLPAAPKEKGDDTKASGKSSTAKERTAKKPVAEDQRAPRMPAHFNKVIDEKQREKIVGILNDYSPQVEKKRAELEALLNQRDKDLFAVLTPAQRKQVEALRAESLAKRQAAASDDEEKGSARIDVE